MSNPATVVEHVVVLMLENRSFDHMLGWMKSHITSLNGLDGTQWKPGDASNPVVRVSTSNDAGYTDPDIDPSHWTPDVLDQIYSVYKCGTKPPDIPSIGPNATTLKLKTIQSLNVPPICSPFSYRGRLSC